MSGSSTAESVRHAARLISQADSLIIAAGAGMGVDSGLPDFRGNDGFWKAYPALAKSGIDFRAIASPAAFADNPLRAWGFYGHRLALYRRTTPHDGFGMLLKWARTKAHGYWVYTSNVDRQFQKAGYDELRIHECHGSVHYLQCTQPCHDSVWPADDVDPEVDESRCELRSALPVCHRCGKPARPNVLMFDDWQWTDQRQQVQENRQREWLSRVKKPVVIEIGAGTAIATVRYFSERIVRQHNGQLIRINLREPRVADGAGTGLGMAALDALRSIDSALVQL